MCLACVNPSHKVKDCYTKSKLTCGYCKLAGHIEKVCIKKEKAEARTMTEHKTDTVDTTPDFSFTTNVTHADKTITHNNNTNIQDKLLEDRGAACHIVNNADLFITYDSRFKPRQHYIQLADGRQSNGLAIAKGNANYTILDIDGQPRTVTLTNALLAPNFPTRLFSVCAATDVGAEISFTKGASTLISNDTTFNIEKCGKLFYLQTVHAHPTYTTKTLLDWHTALGHTNYDDIKELEIVTSEMGISQTKLDIPCLTCEESKMTKQPKTCDYHSLLLPNH